MQPLIHIEKNQFRLKSKRCSKQQARMNGHRQVHQVTAYREQRSFLKQCCMLQLSRAIGEENQLQRKQAESLEELMEQARAGLKRGMRRLNKAFHQSRSNHLIYLFLFCVSVSFLLYFWSKFRG